ncbi:MAG: orotate phosphoribosyltransferase [Pirellulales bacterium]|nr:orotate phosphoribosyltransferase [Pirellulales bacterium]
MYDPTALATLIRQEALKTGQFTLASGKKSHYYLDCRKVTLNSLGACLIAEGMLDLLADNLPDLVGGMAIGADPITGALITLAGLRGKRLRGIMIRKESKKHGTGQFVEGPYVPGERVVLVEDVVTTGGSALLAIDRCQAVGLTVDCVLAVVDRLEGGREAFAERGYDLTSLLTIRDLGL